MNDEGPVVSVGLPVWNGAGTISTAISAILEQTFRDIELIISDNASTDNTVELCETFANSDPRIRIIRQNRNLGPIANFGTVLRAARGRCFMFAAADDRLEPNFIEETLAMVDACPGAVACAPRTLIHFGDGRCREAYGSGAITGPSWWRPARFLLRPADNSRFYGLYRTEAMKAAYPGGLRFYAFDWVVSALTLAEGTHLRSDSIILHRAAAVRGKYYRQHLSTDPGPLERLFPVARMSTAVISRLRPGQRPLAVLALALLNAQMFLAHIYAAVRGIARR